jgi:hypothetical protein
MGGASDGVPSGGYTDYDGIDFSDLGVDMARHQESLGAFARMKLDARSVRPVLRARDLVFVRVPSGSFLIGVTGGDLSAQEEAEKRRGCTDFEVIHETARVEEAHAVRAEVERYFLRHFPRRTLSGAHGVGAVDSKDSEEQPSYHVYVACYVPAT